MAPLKRNISSLIGGIAVAIAVFILWLLVTGAASAESVVAGLAVATAIGTWVRLADL